MKARRPSSLVDTAMDLQTAYAAARAAWRAKFDELMAAGAFRAPAHLVPAVQQELLLEPALREGRVVTVPFRRVDPGVHTAWRRGAGA